MSTSTIAPAAAPVVRKFDAVCDAIRDVHDEASLWKLSDELVRIAPQGVQSVEEVVSQAKARDIPTKSTNTLRLYRDVAIRFPAPERVTGVTFSAHREAIAVGDSKQARQVLIDLASKYGPAGVTVTTVKSAIGAVTGKVPAAPKSKGSVQSSHADVAKDLSTGGKAFAAALPAMLTVNGVTLDNLHQGLSAVLTEVEALRSKAARKAAQAKAKQPATPVNPNRSRAAASAKAAAAKAASASGKATAPAKSAKAGDLRDL